MDRKIVSGFTKLWMGTINKERAEGRALYRLHLRSGGQKLGAEGRALYRLHLRSGGQKLGAEGRALHRLRGCYSEEAGSFIGNFFLDLFSYLVQRHIRTGILFQAPGQMIDLTCGDALYLDLILFNQKQDTAIFIDIEFFPN